ncbi:DUF523 domain-containing protein [Domibacillus sp. DTU_2020_1001157_1_SI_ALB_TIR_016]|uniref:DUF523 domain-containing protein n=1 Tax=Domibacillus sp. DTU_2020_1001157_1_SI_ALB_TIR_016 TaxID=3077789 RepID=UPI0028EAD3FE|nr:DUF523 domain-containing protein [Domibacillus sp. DTU_2020_1001157_1_SI_ALB_TIR_016]WNS81502.1 DUF523 domain-containing protein [Domibacillus sp. DTU_2020_1001157_1_SI_ALB_TIR_016]
MIMVSSCLAGMKVRYNGTDRLDERIRQLVEEKKAVMVCPELLGGFQTPRPPAEIVGGTGEDVLDGRAKVIDQFGNDVTDMYVAGARAALKTAQEIGAEAAVLKENSPSCGSRAIYNGSFSGEKIAGAGVTTALLRRHGIRVLSEEAFSDEIDDDVHPA